MHEPVLPTWTVKDVLDARQHAAGVFLDFKLGCVGCAFQKFCSLKEVSEIYSIDLQTFLAKLEHLGGGSQKKSKESRDEAEIKLDLSRIFPGNLPGSLREKRE